MGSAALNPSSGISLLAILPRKFVHNSNAGRIYYWPAAGFEDTEFGVLMEPEVGHGAAEVYAGVQA